MHPKGFEWSDHLVQCAWDQSSLSSMQQMFPDRMSLNQTANSKIPNAAQHGVLRTWKRSFWKNKGKPSCVGAPDRWDSHRQKELILCSNIFRQIKFISSRPPVPRKGITQTVETVEKVGKLTTNATQRGFIHQRTPWQNTNQAMKIKW